MRVLFLTHNFPRTPDDLPGNFVYSLAMALRRGGVEVEVLAPAGPGLLPRETIGDVPVHRYRYAPRPWETLAYTGRMTEDVRDRWTAKLALVGMIGGAALETRRLARGFDLVHAHWWFPSGLSAWLSLIPYVVTLHGSDVRLGAGRAAGLFRRVLRQAAGTTAVSNWLAQRARDVTSVEPLVAPMPVHERFVPTSERRTGAFLFVGKLAEQKGITHLLEAVSLCRSNPTLDVVGDGPLSGELRRRAEELGIGPRVRWLGALPNTELPSLYRTCRGLVVPSVDEGLGMVAVEGMSCAAPVIASASGGLTDLVDGATGWPVPPSNPAALAHAIDQVSEDPAGAQTRALRGHARVSTTFSAGAVAARYMAVYRDAIARS